MEYITRTTDAVADGSHSSKIKLIHNRVKKIKVSEKMGGKYMQRWEEMAYARQDGIAEGRAEGEDTKLIKLICRKLQKNKTPEEIAEDLEEEPATIRLICEVAEDFAPAYDVEKIYEKYDRIVHSGAEQKVME